MVSTANDVDFRCFLRLDLKKSSSVQSVVPLVDGRGDVKLVPLHIRGCSSNPRMVLKEMRLFRKMRCKQQESELAFTANLTRHERREFENNLASLEELRGKLLEGNDAAWDAVAEPVDCYEQLALAESAAAKKKSRARGSRTTGAVASGRGRGRGQGHARAVSPVPRRDSRNHESSDDSTTAATRTVSPPADIAMDATAATDVSPPPRAPPVTPAPARRQAVGRRAATVAPRPLGLGGHTSLASSEEDRAAMAAHHLAKARSGNHKRKAGELSTRVSHLSDTTSNLAVDQAAKRVAHAADTIRPSGERSSSMARRMVCFIDVNECIDTPAGGGQMRDEDCKMERPRITVVGPSDVKELHWVVSELVKSVKHYGDPNYPQTLTMVGVDENHLSLPPTESMIEKRGLERKGPSQTPRTTSETLADRHSRLDGN